MPSRKSPLPPLSPQPSKPKEMNFYEALEAMLSGAVITKASWNDPASYLFMKNDILTLRRSDTGQDYDLIVHRLDITGSDWYILNRTVVPGMVVTPHPESPQTSP